MSQSHPLDLTGRTILVTGASSGIGRGTAHYLARLGARLVLVARDRGRLEAARAELAGDGHLVERFDLTQIDAIPAWLADLAGRANGKLDGLVHCAGLGSTMPARSISHEHLNTVMLVNVHAAMALARGFQQKAVYRPEGASLVFMASIAGLVGQAGKSAYCASKGALVAMTKALALEFARKAIRVNCVAPALVATELTEAFRNNLTPDKWAEIEAAHPLGVGAVEDVAGAVAYLLAPTGRWITGTSLVVDGGYTAG